MCGNFSVYALFNTSNDNIKCDTYSKRDQKIKIIKD